MKRNLTPIFDFSTIERNLKRNLERSVDRIEPVLVNPKRHLSELEYSGITFSKKYLDILLLILIVRYLDFYRPFSEYILLEIENYLSKNLLFPELQAICKTEKENILSIIFFHSKVNNTRKFFGNLLNEQRIERVISKVHLKLDYPRKVKRTQRRRGYRDQGSKRPDHRWLPSSDYSLDEEQIRIEEKRKSYHSKVDSLLTPMRVGLPKVVSK